MKAKLNCREVTALVLAGEDRRLTLGERVGMRLHLLICKACPRFVQQVTLMRRALNRWKADVEG
ncbi:MAG: zf-HC2 domain-containing protein [Rubrivivax sp.]|nr:zf-HC2 domain-containing protein [Rubrivivax sp.]